MKCMYMTLLASTLLLVGCAEEQAKVETDVAEDVQEAEHLTLTAEEKKHYYKQYEAIVARVNDEHGTMLALESIVRFSHWVSEEQLEERLRQRLEASFTIHDEEEPHHPQFAQKHVTLQIGADAVPLLFKASFDTQLNNHTDDGYQVFAAFHDILSEATYGHWTQLGYEGRKLEPSVYEVTVGGTYAADGIISQHIAEIPYYVTKTGGVY